MPAQPARSHTGTATILFTDLVGSTAQRAQLGEEAAETLRRAHDRLLGEAVAAHHGTVAKSVGDGSGLFGPYRSDLPGFFVSWFMKPSTCTSASPRPRA